MPMAKPRRSGKPSHHQADDADIDDAGADSAEQAVGQIQHRRGWRSRGRQDPAEPGQRCSRWRSGPRAEAVDQPALAPARTRSAARSGCEKVIWTAGSPAPSRGLERLDEQRPDVLRARDRHHDHEAQQELNSTSFARRRSAKASAAPDRVGAARSSNSRALAAGRGFGDLAKQPHQGRMAEWFKAAVLKTAVGASPP